MVTRKNVTGKLYMKKKNKSNIGWLVSVQEDPKTKDLFIELPDALCKQMDLIEDDNVIWEEQTDGSWYVTKVKKK